MPQTKTQAGGKKARLLWYFLRGSKRFYLAAVLCSVCITFLDMLTPQLIRITIDNVLGQLPLNVPAFALRMQKFIDGLEFQVDGSSGDTTKAVDEILYD